MQMQVLPFSRGKTFYGGRTIDTSNYDGVQLEGAEYARTNVLNASATGPNSGAFDDVMVVRNVSGINLLPGRLVRFQAGTAGRVDGYTSTSGGGGLVAGVVDPSLPAAGVPNGDLFYVVRGSRGCLLKTSISANATFIAPGDILFAETAASSTGNTTAAGGRVVPLNSAGTFSAAQTTDGTAAGVAACRIVSLSARTTGQTNSDVLCSVRIN